MAMVVAMAMAMVMAMVMAVAMVMAMVMATRHGHNVFTTYYLRVTTYLARIT